MHEGGDFEGPPGKEFSALPALECDPGSEG